MRAEHITPGERVEVEIIAKHGELADSIQDAMVEKVSKLPRFFERTTGIHVVADMSHAEPELEIIVSAEGTSDFFAKDKGTNVMVALDKTIAKIEQQLRKHKEKITEHRKHAPKPTDSEE